MSFRFNFSLQVLMNLCFMGTFFFTANFIFNHIESIGFWNKHQFFFFLAFAFAVDQIHYLIFSHNFWQFSEDVRLGRFDFHLLKPISSLMIVFTREVAIPALLTIILSLWLLVYFGMQLNLPSTSWFFLPVGLFVSLFFLVGIEILISMFNFITVEGSGINQVRLQLQHFCRWPDFIYKNPMRFILIPLLLITSCPVRFLLQPTIYWSWFVIMIGGTFILWTMIYKIWSKVICVYESPSS